MKNLELELSGVQSLSTQEMKSVDGGFLVALAVIGMVLLLSGCGSAKGLGSPGCSRE